MTKSRARTVDRHALDDLGLLSAVIDAGSFVRAGEALGLTQSAVSRAIQRLEARVGIQLFYRTARSISLTDEGRRFYDSVAPHLEAIEDATLEAAGSSAAVRGRLRVNVDAGIGQFLLTPFLTPFLERYPELSVEIAVRDRMGDLVKDGFDVAVRFGQPRPSALKARLLKRTRVCTYASPDYVARFGAPKRPKDVESHQCVLMRDPATGSPFAWEFVKGRRRVSVNVRGQLVVDAVGPLLAGCIAGQGIAQVLEPYARRPVADGNLVQLLPEWAEETYPLYAYHHPGAIKSAKLTAFLDFVTELSERYVKVYRLAHGGAGRK